MSTFRYLLCDAPELENSKEEFSTKVLVDYLKTRFLGVICHFEQILINDHEKSLKREILLSIGEIMRFMGSENITQFRFKLLAVLRTALDIKQVDLKDVCAKVWKIFISTVDLVELGPLLSTIIVSLEPLMETHYDAVNSILRLLIIENGNLLSTHVADLFFLPHTNVSDEIKSHVAPLIDDTNNSFEAKLKASLKYINHDNLTIRIYGLNHLTNLFENNRRDVNDLIVGQQKMHIEHLLDTLMLCIKSHDEALQVAAGRCLGKLAALEPSHLSPNYRPQASFARSINTDEFAITALTELCSAYQSQKDTKNVDAYSLAIQEILADRKVCPSKSQNLKVWEAIPDRMKSLVEPLLTSCYTITQPLTRVKIHPVFGSIRCTTYEEWAFTWASKTIDLISDEPIRSLLRSFKLSMRFDIRILTMALPYIILHAIQSSNEDDRKEIADEFFTVSNYIVHSTSGRNDQDTGTFSSESRRTYTFYKTVRDLDFSASANDSDSNAKTDTSYGIAIKCAKLLFNQLDFLDRWVRISQSDKSFNVVNAFVNQFDKRLLASANYKCGEHARALMYLEAYIEENRTQRLQTELSFLFQIYAELMDPDSLEGALNMKVTEPTLNEQIIRNNVQGRLQESTVCYERMMHVHGLVECNAKDMIECYLGLDQPETAILLAEGLMKELYDQNYDIILQSTAEPLWRLSRFESLEELIENSNFKESPEWGIRCGQILLDFRKNDTNVFEAEINKSRLTVLKDLRIVGDEQNCYHKGYSNVMKLHLISEIEQAHSLMSNILNGDLNASQIPDAVKKLFDDWDGRLQVLQPAARIVEPVLCLRRILLNEVKSLVADHCNLSKNIFKALEDQVNDYVGRSWIKSIELARDDGCIQQADLYILNAESYNPKFLLIEKAKLQWKKGDQTNCFKALKRAVDELKPSATNRKSIESLALAEAKFLIAYYNAESLNMSNNLNVNCFKEAIKSESEKAFVHYAQYLDKTLAVTPDKLSQDQYNPKTYDLQLECLLLYFKSMQYGSKYIYQSMPRALSIWFDFTATNDFKNKKQEEHFRKVVSRMNQIAENYINKLPALVFFTAFSQLVSRICHPSADVYNHLRTILVKLILAFPQQSLWMILSVAKSSYASRVRRCNEVMSDKRLGSKEMQKMITDFMTMASQMIDLTNKELPSKQSNFSINFYFPSLPKLLSKSGFSILMPTQKFIQPVLPALHHRDEPANAFNAFPNTAVYITGMLDELTVLPSLQKPRRVTLRGSDGNKYTIMMKPKDDLRKDFRLMEFNSVVKQYLHQNSEARQRHLNIRTYAVLPLNEECGILEWVPNLQAFRHIVNGECRIQFDE